MPYLALCSDAKSNPTKRYVNMLLFRVARTCPSECVLTESTGLPDVPDFEGELPPFSTVVNRLKIMGDLDPLIYPQRQTTQFGIIVFEDDDLSTTGLEYNVHLVFDDASDQRVNLRVERGV